MAKWQFTKGVHDLGRGCFAWLQPDGGWGLANAGLVVDGDQSMLVDTLMDLKLTREMLDGMRAATPAAQSIGTLVNTHGNADHTFGNQLVSGARIIASKLCVEDMRARPPEQFADHERRWRELGEGGAFFHDVMGRHFKYDDVVLTLPTETFDDEMKLKVGDKDIELLTVGPAHTRGDILVYVPKDRTVFTGDIVFTSGHPAIWAGSCTRWIAACDTILNWDVETVVPGHGGITDKSGVRTFKSYLEYIKAETCKRFDAGMNYYEAAMDISLEPYNDWLDYERMVPNCAALYREFSGRAERPDIMRMFAEMGRYREARKHEVCLHGHSHG